MISQNISIKKSVILNMIYEKYFQKKVTILCSKNVNCSIVLYLRKSNSHKIKKTIYYIDYMYNTTTDEFNRMSNKSYQVH